MNQKLTDKEFVLEVQALRGINTQITFKLPYRYPVTGTTCVRMIDYTQALSRELLDLYFEYWDRAKKAIRNYHGECELLNWPFVTNQQKFKFMHDAQNLLNELDEKLPVDLLW